MPHAQPQSLEHPWKHLQLFSAFSSNFHSAATKPDKMSNNARGTIIFNLPTTSPTVILSL
jgi:hypothetical protein